VLWIAVPASGRGDLAAGESDVGTESGDGHYRAVTEVTGLLDDLARLLDVTTANADPDQRRRAVDAAGRVRMLRARLAALEQIPPAGTPGPWYGSLAAALGDTSTLPHAALTERIEQLEHVIENVLSRRWGRWLPPDRS
jgi:hypothetical protein